MPTIFDDITEDEWTAPKKSIFDDIQDDEWKPESSQGVISGVVSPIGKGLAAGSLDVFDSIDTAAEYITNRLGLQRKNKKPVEVGGYLSKIISESEKVSSKDKFSKIRKESLGKLPSRDDLEPPESIRNKNVVDNPELLKKPEWWLYNASRMAPGLFAAILPAAKVKKAITLAGTTMRMTPKVIKRLAVLGASITGGSIGGGLEATSTYRDVLKTTGDEEEAARAAELMFFFVAGLNAVSTGKILDDAGKTFISKIGKSLGSAGVEALTEGLEEPAEVSAKIAAKYIRGKELPKNIKDQFVASLKNAATVAPIAGLTGGTAAAINQFTSTEPRDSGIGPQITSEQIVNALSSGQMTAEQANDIKSEYPNLSETIDDAISQYQKQTEKPFEFPKQTQDEQEQIAKDIEKQRTEGFSTDKTLELQNIRKRNQDIMDSVDLDILDEAEQVVRQKEQNKENELKQAKEQEADINAEAAIADMTTAKRRFSALSSIWDTLSDTEQEQAINLVLPRTEPSNIEAERKKKAEAQTFTRTSPEQRAIEAQRKLKEADRLGLELENRADLERQAAYKSEKTEQELKKIGQWTEQTELAQEPTEPEPPPAEPAPSQAPPTSTEKERFHGTSKKIPSLAEFSYATMNYYGQGFHTTDSRGIAEGYTKKGKGKEPTVYKVMEKNPVKVFDMESDMPGWLMEKVKNDPSDLVQNVLENDDPKTLRELYDNVREQSKYEGVSADGVQEIFDSISYNLEQQGYGAMSHVGGKLTGNKPHEVVIYFNPARDLDISESKPTKSETQQPLSVTDETQIPQFKNTESAVKFGEQATPEQVSELQRLENESRSKELEYRKAKDYSDERAENAYQAQLYREAIEASKGEHPSQRDTRTAEETLKPINDLGKSGRRKIAGAYGEVGEVDSRTVEEIEAQGERRKSKIEIKKLKDTLKNEKGSSQLYTDIINHGISLKQKGIDTLQKFRVAMKEKFGQVWEKIKDHMRDLWNILSNQRGELKIERSETRKQRVDDLIAQLNKNNEVKSVKVETENKAEQTDLSDYEKVKDIWFGDKDERILENKVELSNLQDEIKSILKIKRYNQKARDIDSAIQIYIDLKNKPDHLKKYYDGLTPKQKRIVDLSQNLTDDVKKIADKISNSYKSIGLEALDAGVIRNVRDNYAARIWDLKGRPSSQERRKFGTTTRHAKQRKFDTILEGWSNGYELKVNGASNNLNILKNEIVKTIQDKKFLKELMGLAVEVDGKPRPLVTTKEYDDYVEIKHPNFVNWEPAGKTIENKSGEIKWYGKNSFADETGLVRERKSLYAPKDVAKNLNNILETSKYEEIPAIHIVVKYNAITKSWILQSSFFHHLAFMRSYYLGTNHKTWKEMNIRRAYKEGYESIKKLDPIIRLAVRNGLTLGVYQDWNENLLREKTAIGRILDKNKVSREVKDKILMLREMQADFLFSKFGAGLKAKAFAIEYRNQLKKHPNQNPDIIAKRVANLINDDFGGLHLGRIGRNPTHQLIFRIFMLAPDWCCLGDTRAMTKAGWKYYHELEIGKDEILAFNPETNKYQWSMLNDMYVRDDFDDEMVKVKNHNRAIMMTKDHKCYVYNISKKKNEVVLAKNLNTAHRIPRTCDGFEYPKIKTIDDELVRYAGWLVTDGYVKKCYNKLADGTTKEYRYGKISQSKPDTVEILKNMGMKYYVREKGSGDHGKFKDNYPNHIFTIPKEYFEKLESYGIGQTLKYEFLELLTKDQLEILYDTMMLADGTGQRRFCGEEDSVFYMTLVQTMLGKQTTFYQQEEKCWRTRTLKDKKKYITCQRSTLKRERVKGAIWCPSVDTGFWLAEREGLMFITGNTESNIRTMIKSIKAGSKEETALYRKFWAGVLIKGIGATVLANFALAGGDPEELWKRYKKAWKAGHFRWLDVDITPIYQALGGKTKERKYFSILGHFKDPTKFIAHPVRSLHHKGSVVYKTMHEALTGVNWAGQKYTTFKELVEEGRLTKYGAASPLGYSQIPAYAISQIIGAQPVQVQNAIRWSTGDMEAFDAITNSMGLGTSTTYSPKNKVDFSDLSDDSVAELERLEVGFNLPKRKVRINNVQVEVEEEIYRKIADGFSKELSEKFNRKMSLDNWDKIPDDRKRKRLMDIRRKLGRRYNAKLREAAQNQLDKK